MERNPPRDAPPAARPPGDAGEPAAFERAGAALHRRGALREAAAVYRRYAAAHPGRAAAWANLGIVSGALGEAAAAWAAVRRAALLAPGLAEAWFAVGNAASRLDETEAAARLHGRAVRIDPTHAAAWLNLAIATMAALRPEPAGRALRRAAVLAPGLASAWTNLGHVVLAESAQKARRCFLRAATAAPAAAEAQFALATLELRRGDFAAGWARYGHLRRTRLPIVERRVALPAWGEVRDPTGLVLWNNQVGIGEEIMYAGLLPETAATVGRLVVVASPKLRPLLARSFPALTTVADLPDDLRALGLGPRPAQAPLIEAAARLRRSFADFARHDGYLVPDPARLATLGARYRAGGAGPVVGIAWASPLGMGRAVKAVPLAEWGRLLAALAGRLVSLQYAAPGRAGERDRELADARAAFGLAIHADPDIDAFADLDGHAAQIAAVDRVVTISNVTAHLAGALGRRVDLLLPAQLGTSWWWFEDRPDCPWYPAMRIHRARPGESRTAFLARVAADL